MGAPEGRPNFWLHREVWTTGERLLRLTPFLQNRPAVPEGGR